MNQIEESNLAVKKEFTELDKKRKDFEEQIKNEVSQKSSIISVKEEIASIISRFENIEETRIIMDPKCDLNR
jgi:seryl-tRNA synthetase